MFHGGFHQGLKRVPFIKIMKRLFNYIINYPPSSQAFGGAAKQIPRFRGFLGQRFPGGNLSHEKNPTLLSIESWLINRDQLIMVYYNPHITG